MTDFRKGFKDIGMDFIELLGDLKNSVTQDLYDYTAEIANLHLVEKGEKAGNHLLQELETRFSELEERHKDWINNQRQALLNLSRQQDRHRTPKMLRDMARQLEKKGRRVKGKRTNE